MIIDIHTHDFAGYEDSVPAELKRHGVDYFVNLGDVLRFGEFPNAEEIREINSTTLKNVHRYADWCCGFCYLNPANSPESIREEMARCLTLPEFRGVKLEISLNCRDPRMDVIMEELQKYDMPLLQHTWYKTTSKGAEESDPSDVAYLARRFPHNTIIMAHLCPCGILGVEDIAECPNVVVDTSGAQPEAGYLEYALKRIGVERIVYGSDAPCRDVGTQLAKVQEADLSDEEREMIFCQNARRLLKL